MKNPKISVVMPVYNTKEFLEESIQSILNQSFKEFEFIIVDDKSTDTSLNIINKYKKKDKRIVLIKNKKNIGQASSRNKGLKKAKGKYIAVLDSDDLAVKKRLEIQFNYLEKNPHIFLVGSSAIYINEKGKEIRRFRKYDDYKMLAWRLPKSCSIIHSSIMFRNTKEFYHNRKFKIGSEYDLYLNILESGKNLTNLPQFLVKYRVHSKSISSTKKEKQRENVEKTRASHPNLNSKLPFETKIKYALKLGFFYLRTYLEKRSIF